MAGRISYYGKIAKDGLLIHVDSAKYDSYPKQGTYWYDISGNQNHATLINNPTFINNNNGIFEFNPVQVQWASFSPVGLPYGRSASTLCAWARLATNDGNWHWIISYGSPNFGGVSGSEARFLGTEDGFFYFGGYVDDISGSSVQENTWFYAVGVYNDTTASLYINGQFIKSESKFWNTTQNAARIGQQVNEWNEYWDGSISQVSIYNRALTDTEIMQNFNALRGRYNI